MQKGPRQKEEEKLREALESGDNPECPRCGSRLASCPVPPRADVAYVRNRILLQCGSCGFKIAIDRK